MTLENIIQNIVSGEMTRDIDEKYAGGFWDYAGEIVLDSTDPTDEHLQSEIYYALWEVADLLINGDGANIELEVGNE